MCQIVSVITTNFGRGETGLKAKARKDVVNMIVQTISFVKESDPLPYDGSKVKTTVLRTNWKNVGKRKFHQKVVY